MPGIFDDVQLDVRIVLFDLVHQLLKLPHITKLIPVAMNKQNWFAACLEKTEVVLVYRSADADEVNIPLVCNSNFEPDASAKRETAKRDWLFRKRLGKILQTGANIFELTASFVVLRSAVAHAAQVNSQGNHSGTVQGAGGTKT